jgi:hypothetical protein
MFEKYVIVDQSLRATDAGWAVGLRIPYYRGLGLSMVNVQLELNGQAVPAERVTVELPGRSYALTELPDVIDDRWGFGETLTAIVRDAVPFTGTSYELGVTVVLRVSYLPMPSVTTVRKTVAVRQEAAR